MLRQLVEIATRAAIRAGYSPKSATVQASKLLRKANIKDEVARIQEETSLRLEIRRDDVIIGLLGAIELARSLSVLTLSADNHIPPI